MKNTTICALSTPPGSGAIGLIRVSGRDTLDIVRQIAGRNLDKLQPGQAFFCRVMDDQQVVDETVFTFFKGPHSFTGEDTIEISCHGSSFIIGKILSLLTKFGAQPAQAGEFTMRAFMNGKMDLSQAEAVADLIASESAAAHRIAMNQMRGGFSGEIKKLRDELIHFASLIELELDFAEEDVEFADRKQLFLLIDEIDRTLTKLIDSFEYGNAIKNGIPVAIAGAPNAGKSTLLNTLLNEEKAIVSNIPGTTRDVIEDTLMIQGLLFRVIDTAGIRENPDNEIERIGIERTFDKIKTARIILYVADSSNHFQHNHQAPEDFGTETQKALSLQQQFPGATVLMVATKSDLRNSDIAWSQDIPLVVVSAKENTGIETLKNKLVQYGSGGYTGNEQVIVSNVRHLHILQKAQQSMQAARTGLNNHLPGDLVAMDIRATLHYLGEITGTISTEDLLGNIFSKFCIGK